MSEENKENMQQNEGVKIDIESPEAEIIENADRLQEAENQAEEADMGGGEIGILKKQVENLENILKEKNEEILRRAADLDNYRKRLTKETEDKIRFANQAVVKDFLPVIDNIEMALQHTEEASPLREGIELTIKSFKDVLSRHGVTEINSAIGTSFDPAIHEAIMMDNSAEYENNTVTLCVQKGYILNDRVIDRKSVV